MDDRVTAAISARALAKEFRGGIKALAGVDFSVDPGEIFAYLGRNGSGKTPFLAALRWSGGPPPLAEIDHLQPYPDRLFDDSADPAARFALGSRPGSRARTSCR